MHTRRAPQILAIATAAALCACDGTDVGNPVIDIDPELYNDSFPDTSSAAQAWHAPGETITINDAWIAVERVRLRSAADCSGGAELEIVGPIAVDLRAAGAPPLLSNLSVPSIDYCRFELRWHSFSDGLPAEAPPELLDASMYFAGTRGDGTPFTLRSDRGDELRLDGVGGAFPVGEATNALFVAFDGEVLFSGVNLDTAAVDGDGVIRIEDGSNDAQLDVFENNVDAATKLFDDDDDDGILDGNERDPDDTLAE